MFTCSREISVRARARARAFVRRSFMSGTMWCWCMHGSILVQRVEWIVSGREQDGDGRPALDGRGRRRVERNEVILRVWRACTGELGRAKYQVRCRRRETARKDVVAGRNEVVDDVEGVDANVDVDVE